MFSKSSDLHGTPSRIFPAVMSYPALLHRSRSDCVPFLVTRNRDQKDDILVLFIVFSFLFFFVFFLFFLFQGKLLFFCSRE